MLFKFEDKIISKDDIISALKNVGIKSGDHLCIYSELFKFGKMLKKRDELLSEIIDAIARSVGMSVYDNDFAQNAGTIFMPTFTYEFCKTGIYDKTSSKSQVGILGEHFRKMPNVYRTNDPIFNFAIYGKEVDKYKKDYSECLGQGCIFSQMIENDAKFVAFGNAGFASTIVNYAEAVAGVPYRYNKTFNGYILDENGKKSEVSMKYFVRRLDIKTTLSMPKILDEIKKHGAIKIVNIGGASIGVVECKKYFQITYNALKNNPFCFLDD